MVKFPEKDRERCSIYHCKFRKIARMKGQAEISLCDNHQMLRKKYEKNKPYSKELKVSQTLGNHPNLIQYENFNDMSLLCCFCQNEDLLQLRNRKGCFGHQQTQFVVRNIIGGLAHMHENGVIHRDVKLSNIFIEENGQLKLGDYGISDQIKKLSMRNKGTQGFISPEIQESNETNFLREIDKMPEKIDIYSIGSCIWSMLFGQVPFQKIRQLKSFYRIFKCRQQIIQKYLMYRYPDHQEQITLSLCKLLKSLLNYEPSKRPTLSQILQSQWMNECTKMSSIDFLTFIKQKQPESSTGMNLDMIFH